MSKTIVIGLGDFGTKVALRAAQGQGAAVYGFALEPVRDMDERTTVLRPSMPFGECLKSLEHLSAVKRMPVPSPAGRYADFGSYRAQTRLALELAYSQGRLKTIEESIVKELDLHAGDGVRVVTVAATTGSVGSALVAAVSLWLYGFLESRGCASVFYAALALPHLFAGEFRPHAAQWAEMKTYTYATLKELDEMTKTAVGDGCLCDERALEPWWNTATEGWPLHWRVLLFDRRAGASIAELTDEMVQAVRTRFFSPASSICDGHDVGWNKYAPTAFARLEYPAASVREYAALRGWWDTLTAWDAEELRISQCAAKQGSMPREAAYVRAVKEVRSGDEPWKDSRALRLMEEIEREVYEWIAELQSRRVEISAETDSIDAWQTAMESDRRLAERLIAEIENESPRIAQRLLERLLPRGEGAMPLKALLCEDEETAADPVTARCRLYDLAVRARQQSIVCVQRGGSNVRDDILHGTVNGEGEELPLSDRGVAACGYVPLDILQKKGLLVGTKAFLSQYRDWYREFEDTRRRATAQYARSWVGRIVWKALAEEAIRLSDLLGQLRDELIECTDAIIADNVAATEKHTLTHRWVYADLTAKEREYTALPRPVRPVGMGLYQLACERLYGETGHARRTAERLCRAEAVELTLKLPHTVLQAIFRESDIKGSGSASERHSKALREAVSYLQQTTEAAVGGASYEIYGAPHGILAGVPGTVVPSDHNVLWCYRQSYGETLSDLPGFDEKGEYTQAYQYAVGEAKAYPERGELIPHLDREWLWLFNP